LFLFLLLMATGCATTSVPDPEPAPMPEAVGSTEKMLRYEIQPWLGTPHRMGGMNRRGIDCSGLVVILYGDLFHRQLPRTTSTLIHIGRWVERKNLSAGDLVFFKPKWKVNHVGIYLGRGEFVHTSTSNGVMISRMDDIFWRRCYFTGRRLL
jgi:cell wall-associated NlpC family hydrolase